VRFYPKNGHGALVDVDYRIDVDADGWHANSGFFVTDFLVAHAGYAYRRIIESPHKFRRFAWAFTPHVSLAAGAAFTQRREGYDWTQEQSPVVGGRLGVDVDLHIRRFFMGWTFRYEFLAHTKGSLSRSNFIAWNIVPVLAIGAVLGRPAHPRPDD